MRAVSALTVAAMVAGVVYSMGSERKELPERSGAHTARAVVQEQAVVTRGPGLLVEAETSVATTAVVAAAAAGVPEVRIVADQAAEA